MKKRKTKSNEAEGKCYNVYSLGITVRVALFLLLFVFIPMILTGIGIEKQLLLPGENMYLAIPIFFIPLLIPFARFISYYLINRDLQNIERFCEEVKKGNYASYFDVPNQKEEEDSLITLYRNLNWMAHNLALRADNAKDRINKLRCEYGEMEKQALTDPLTGLFNRRYLKKFSSSYTVSSDDEMLSMIYVDCDNFKTVNDTRGHGTGDQLLQWLATCLKDSSRGSQDIPLRMGGDEFALLLPRTEAAEAALIGKRLRSLYHRRITHDTTLSLGIASINCERHVDWPLVELLTQHADQQAYMVKKAGGNNIGLNGLLVDEGHSSNEYILETQKLAGIDPLTGIPNRYLAKERFQQALKRTRRNGNKLCLLFLDLDDFKSINDSLGHHTGDTFLKHIVGCIKSTIRDEDSVCRLGGDEFLILMENLKDKDDVTMLVAKVINSVRQSAIIERKEVSVTSSAGITLVPDDGDDFEDLCKKADIALLMAKESGKNTFSFFDAEMEKTTKTSLSLINDLRSAILLDQLELYFQPQIDLESGKITGTESLVRWHHPTKGILSPACFIPLAERSGLILELGEWIIAKACCFCAEWKKMGIEDLVVSINISPIQITRGNVAQSVLAALQKNGLQGSDIELEFTESLLLQNNAAIEKDLRSLSEAGVSLIIDDFGTGYSNLSYLKDFNISKIKIDRSFVSEMTVNKQDHAIVEAIVKMSKSLQLETVAEGIEKEETIDALQGLECNTGQGFYWSKPLPAKQFLYFYTSMTPSLMKSPPEVAPIIDQLSRQS